MEWWRGKQSTKTRAGWQRVVGRWRSPPPLLLVLWGLRGSPRDGGLVVWNTAQTRKTTCMLLVSQQCGRPVKCSTANLWRVAGPGSKGIARGRGRRQGGRGTRAGKVRTRCGEFREAVLARMLSWEFNSICRSSSAFCAVRCSSSPCRDLFSLMSARSVRFKYRLSAFTWCEWCVRHAMASW